MKEDLTLVIYSCGIFSDLWDAHVKLLNQNWPDRSIRTIILTDSPTEKSFEGIEIISAGDGKELTERVRFLLPHLTTEYVLVTLDDYFLTTPISSKAIKRIVEIMDRNKYDYVRLFDRPHCPLNATNDKDIYTYTLDKDYRVNLYSGIWRRSFIESTLPETDLNAWEYEVTLTDRARSVNGRCAVSHGNEFPILDVVRKGRILPKAWRYLKSHNLYHGNRPRFPYRDYLLLGLKTQSNRLLAKLPAPVYQGIKSMCVKLGMQSFSAKQNRK